MLVEVEVNVGLPSTQVGDDVAVPLTPDGPEVKVGDIVCVAAGGVGSGAVGLLVRQPARNQHVNIMAMGNKTENMRFICSP